ncbi:SDR family NAD(P)-dependent oxidoreductase [Aurantimonas sp. VKM B-3413]|uniref:SDR family NAD(P)-dependent oxidoreductase n=1 Tax=Aurantimonas sp. VKM B-3413 TaxID=2779401 RepID=UPI0021079BC7|nr:SDR family oxidoreductase [Aurantimonas sp. VKM B-3413]MCB8840504.1 SDR family oxidoreductase [Aurantimonas sp. VKM B-3413]
MTQPLFGRVVLLTGATGGIGSAIGMRLSQAGAKLILGYRSSQQDAEALMQKLDGDGHMIAKLDVTDTSDLVGVMVEVDARYGKLDILVNCAGTTRFVPHDDLDTLDDALIDGILATNVRGAIAAVRAAKPLLAKSEDGLIVNISSIAAQTGMGSNIAYCASKAALDNLTKSLARALAPSIRVVSISPGLVDTEFVRGLDTAWRNQQEASTPLGRLCSPMEVAEAVLVTSTVLTFTTGSIVPVDGGRQLS